MLVVIEGLDGAGKSTAVQGLTQHLESIGQSYIKVREPGASLNGQIRSIILENDLDLDAETCAFFLDRFQNIRDRLVPALEAGKWVICDRFSTSTFLYQVVGKGFSVDTFNMLDSMVDQRLAKYQRKEFHLDLDFEVAMQRLQGRGDLNRLDITGREAFNGSRSCFAQRAREKAPHYPTHRIDASAAPEEVLKSILSYLEI